MADDPAGERAVADGRRRAAGTRRPGGCRRAPSRRRARGRPYRGQLGLGVLVETTSSMTSRPSACASPQSVAQHVGRGADVLEADVAAGRARAVHGRPPGAPSTVRSCLVSMKMNSITGRAPGGAGRGGAGWDAGAPIPSISRVRLDLRASQVGRAWSRRTARAPRPSPDSAHPHVGQQPVADRPRPAGRGGQPPQQFPAMCPLGLPTTASARAPVQASIAASMAAQSGSPPSGVGQYGSGLVATSAAPCSRTAR